MSGQNPAKHLKWTRKERSTKNNYVLELFPKDITIMNFRLFQTAEYATNYEYALVPNMPGFII